MTSSQWLDLGILAVALVGALSGWQSGALGSLLAFFGVVLGAVAGILLAPHVAGQIDGPRAKLFVTLFLILGLIVIGEIAGVVLGRAARAAIRNRAVRGVDSLVGVALQVVTILLAAWVLAIPLKTSAQPNLAAAVGGSRILSAVGEVAPDALTRKLQASINTLYDSSGLHDVLPRFGGAPIAGVDVPDPGLASDAVVAATKPSVLKIRGVANSCQKVLEGTGFVVAPHRVMSNAHVVAGSDSVTVAGDDGNVHDATVVSYDPMADISILDVPDLDVPPLQFDRTEAAAGADAVVMGYPGGGDFTPTPARIREVIELQGPDIYHTTTVTREVYTIRGSVRQGNSGGPLIDRGGKVLGVVFGAAVDDADTGFVLTAKEVANQMDRVNDAAKVATGTCVS